MSLFSTMNVSASGLETSATTLGVIGDNIANVNTMGFKSSRASFADMIPQNVGGLGGGGQLGRGAALNVLTTQFGQGAITGTGNVNDMAISGSGFFALRDADGDRFFSRNGAFNKDPEGFLNQGGMRLQGYQAIDGQITGQLGDLQIDEANSRPHESTSEIVLSADLPADGVYTAEDGTVETPLTDLMGAGVPPDGTDPTGPTINDLSLLADAETSITVFDSRGVAHEVNIFFERTGEDTWNWVAAVDGGDTGGIDGAAHIIDGGELEFDTDGSLVNRTASTFLAASWSFEGTDQPTIDFQFGLDETGAETGGGVNVTGEGTLMSVQSITQDGAPKGELVAYDIDIDGTIMGSYSNGEEIVLGQVALAEFPANGGLKRAGSGLYTTTAATGEVQMGVAGTGGRGAVYGYSLEKSNVDLESQFVEMIQTQRSYQANARVVNTASDTLQELINLV
jgi:flagellar hook protein FlgE